MSSKDPILGHRTLTPLMVTWETWLLMGKG